MRTQGEDGVKMFFKVCGGVLCATGERRYAKGVAWAFGFEGSTGLTVT